eukprot:Pgem_evm1s14501
MFKRVGLMGDFVASHDLALDGSSDDSDNNDSSDNYNSDSGGESVDTELRELLKLRFP